MGFISQNKADNISVADAQAFVDKMRFLGLPFGELHADETEGMSATATAVIALKDIPEGEITPDGKYFLKSFCNGDFHGIAGLVLRMKTSIEPVLGFTQVCDQVGIAPNIAKLNIPGVNALIAKQITKA